MDLSQRETTFIWYDKQRTDKELAETEAAVVSVQTVYTVLQNLGLTSSEQLDDEREKLWAGWKFNGFGILTTIYHEFAWASTNDVLIIDALLRTPKTRDHRHVWDWAFRAEYSGKPEDYPYKFDKMLIGLGQRKYPRCNSF
jgi:hypothetical protein